MAKIDDVKEYVDATRERTSRSCAFDNDVMVAINTMRVSSANEKTNYSNADLINAALRKALYLPIRKKGN